MLRYEKYIHEGMLKGVKKVNKIIQIQIHIHLIATMEEKKKEKKRENI